MVAGVADEINTPLGYARSNAEIVRNSLVDIRQLCGAQGQALRLLTREDAPEVEVAHALGPAPALAESLTAAALPGDLHGLFADTDSGLTPPAALVQTGRASFRERVCQYL